VVLAGCGGASSESASTTSSTTTTTVLATPEALGRPSTVCEIGLYPVLAEVPESAEVSVQDAGDILSVRVGLSSEDPMQWVVVDVSNGAGAPAGFTEDPAAVSVLTAEGEVSAIETVTDDVGLAEDRDLLLRRLDWVEGDVFVSVQALNVESADRDALVEKLSLVPVSDFTAFETANDLAATCP
jgi:hypothetical protein